VCHWVSIEVEYWNEPTPPDARRLRRQLELEGYSVFEWTDRAGAYYPPHSHAEDQSHWVLSGALTLIVDGEEYTLRAGDRDHLPARTVHEARAEGTESVVYLVGAKY
jgi:quercetin dioxygenase-like cupin family protein